jgi:hypothetical protein
MDSYPYPIQIMDSYSYHMTKWDPQPIVGGSWAQVHPDPLNYNRHLKFVLINL